MILFVINLANRILISRNNSYARTIQSCPSIFIITKMIQPGTYAADQKQEEWEIFSVLVGPVFRKQRFLQANATASLTKTSYEITPSVALPNAQSRAQWQILGVDADWDDESGQVELRIEAAVECLGVWDSSAIGGLSFHVTILALALAA